MKKLLFAAGLGGAIAWLLDQRHRQQARQQAEHLMATGRKQATSAAAAASAQAQGMKEKAAHAPGGDQSPPDDDVTLARKVETEIFRDADVPKGRINVDVVGRVVTLRGEIDDEKQIKKLGKAAGKVDGIDDVQNLLHTPGTPAPNLTGSSAG